MKYVLLTAVLLSAAGSALAQEDIQAKHDAYALCVTHVEKDPRKAYESCTAYLNKYPNDNKFMTDFARTFVTAHEKVSRYVESVPMTHFTEITPKWGVYSPGLLATIPSESSRQGNYSILIKREYGSAQEEKLLLKAEALYRNPDSVDLKLLKDWRYIADKYIALPDGEPKWWTASTKPILGAELVTTEAVLYYYNITQTLRNNDGKVKEDSFKFSTASLKYESSIRKMDMYERGGKTFRDVYIANMTLTWAQLCGMLCGSGFTRNKVVVMTPNGEILEMFLDDPANNRAWVS